MKNIFLITMLVWSTGLYGVGTAEEMCLPALSELSAKERQDQLNLNFGYQSVLAQELQKQLDPLLREQNFTEILPLLHQYLLYDKKIVAATNFALVQVAINEAMDNPSVSTEVKKQALLVAALLSGSESAMEDFFLRLIGGDDRPGTITQPELREASFRALFYVLQLKECNTVKEIDLIEKNWECLSSDEKNMLFPELCSTHIHFLGRVQTGSLLTLINKWYSSASGEAKEECNKIITEHIKSAGSLLMIIKNKSDFSLVNVQGLYKSKVAALKKLKSTLGLKRKPANT